MSRSRLRRGDRNAVRLACALTAVVPLAAWFSVQARADQVDVYVTWKESNICGWFQMHPQVSAVEPMFDAVQQDTGFSSDDTARVLVDAVSVFCPQHMGLLKAYANSEPAPPVAPITAGIGGVYRA